MNTNSNAKLNTNDATHNTTNDAYVYDSILDGHRLGGRGGDRGIY